MERESIKIVNPKEVLLENILLFMNDRTFSKKDAIRAVGGKKKLLRLISSGEIDCTRPCNTRNGKWFCNAADVLRHCRNMRKLINKKSKAEYDEEDEEIAGNALSGDIDCPGNDDVQ